MTTKIYTKTATDQVAIVASLMLATSAVALFLSWGMAAVVGLSALPQSPPNTPAQTVQEQKIVCLDEDSPTLREMLRQKAAGAAAGSGGAHVAAQGAMLRQEAVVLRSLGTLAGGKRPLPQLVQVRGQLRSHLTEYRRAFVAAMRHNPPAAQAMVGEVGELNSQLSDQTTNCLPEPLTVSGTVNSEIAEKFLIENSQPRIVSVIRHTLKTPQGEYLLNLTDDRVIESGTALTLSGQRLGREILVNPLRNLTITKTPGNPPVLGQRRVIPIFGYIKGSSVTTPISTREEIAKYVFQDVADYYGKNSYHQMSIVGDNNEPGTVDNVYPKTGGAYELDIPFACSKKSSKLCNINDTSSCLPEEGICEAQCTGRIVTNALLKAADQDIVFTDNARPIIFFANSPFAKLLCGSEGTAVGASLFSTNDGDVNLATGYINDLAEKSDFNVSGLIAIISHELGHNMAGLGHAATSYCSSYDKPLEEVCTDKSYDPFEVMGAPWLENIWRRTVPRLKSTSMLLEQAGWLKDDVAANHRIVTLPEPHVTQSFVLQPLESQDIKGGPELRIHALKIPHNNPDIYFPEAGGQSVFRSYPFLYIDYRQPIDMDLALAMRIEQEGLNLGIFQGALMYVGEGNNPSRFNPTMQFTASYNSRLPFGQSFTDPNTGTKIILGQPTNNGLPITVTTGRTDFEGPTNLQATFLKQVDPCTVRYVLTAFDPSGISKIVVGNPANPLAVLTQPPYEFDFHYIGGSSYRFSFRAYDNAKQEGGLADNNFTDGLSPKIDGSALAGCDQPAIITIESPDIGVPYITTEHEKENVALFLPPDAYGAIFTELARDYVLRFPPRQNPITFTIAVREDHGLDFVNVSELFTNLFSPEACQYAFTGAMGCFIFSSVLEGYYSLPLLYSKNFQLNLSPPGKHYWYVNTSSNGSGTNVLIEFDLLSTTFTRGEVNPDGQLDISDAITILDYLFLGNVKELACPDAADVNDDGAVTIADAQYLLEYLFLGTLPDPPAPFGQCGQDPTEDNLKCTSFPICRTP